jgi:hypothetical protein
MFRRLLFDHWVSIFPLISFVVSATVYFAISRQALRMKPEQVERQARLPFEDPS